MIAYLIDPHARTVSEVEYDGNIETIYKLIGTQPFDVARINDANDGIFVDDNGLLGDLSQQKFFRIAGKGFGYPEPLAGKGLVLGCNEDGESTSPTLTLDQVKGAVWFVRPSGKPDLADGNVLFMASPLTEVVKTPEGRTISHVTLLSFGSDGPARRVEARNLSEAIALHAEFMRDIAAAGLPYTVTTHWALHAGRKFAGFDRATDGGGPLSTCYVNEDAAKVKVEA